MRDLTIGKTRGLQQLSNSNGIFTICSLDHRRTLRKMMGNGNARNITYETIVDFKLDLCEALAPHSSGVLLDPIYGASQAIAANVIPGETGLMMSLEALDSDVYGSDGNNAEELVDWTIDKVKTIGASGVKFPLYYRPDLPNIASDQLNTVTRSAYECKKADLALFLGPKNYIVKELERDNWEYARKKPDLAIDTVHQLSKLPIDVLKVEFPVEMAYEQDGKRMLDICQQLNAASSVPWVLLSGGVSFEVFCQQLEIACKAGASGFLAGRALWQEAANMPNRDRFKFLERVAVDRMRQLSEMANTYAKPWYSKLETCNNYLYPDLSMEWGQDCQSQESIMPKQTLMPHN